MCGISVVLASKRERVVGARIGEKSRETRRKRRRREGTLPASLAYRVGRAFRSPSFSSPNETLFEHFGEISRATFLRWPCTGNVLRQSSGRARCSTIGRV